MLNPSWSQADLLSDVRFTITADASPGLLPRLMQPFAKRDLLPNTFTVARRADSMRIEIALASIPAAVVHLIEGNLRQVVGVTLVACHQEISGRVARRAA